MTWTLMKDSLPAIGPVLFAIRWRSGREEIASGSYDRSANGYEWFRMGGSGQCFPIWKDEVIAWAPMPAWPSEASAPAPAPSGPERDA